LAIKNVRNVCSWKLRWNIKNEEEKIFKEKVLSIIALCNFYPFHSKNYLPSYCRKSTIMITATSFLSHKIELIVRKVTTLSTFCLVFFRISYNFLPHFFPPDIFIVDDVSFRLHEEAPSHEFNMK
jgi:hypothetical protein